MTATTPILPIRDETAQGADGDRLEVLMILVEAYEQEHHPIGLPDPIEAI